METVTQFLNMLLPVVLIAVGIALIVLLMELVKMLKTARGTVERLEPTIDNVEKITTSLVPAMEQVDPLIDRVQLSVDALNLEMMRLDEILEDVTEITNAASSATAAVDNITSAPVKAVSNVATRVRSAFGGKSASAESAQLAEQRVAVAKALEDYKAAEGKVAESAEEKPAEATPEPNADAIAAMDSLAKEPAVQPADDAKGQEAQA